MKNFKNFLIEAPLPPDWDAGVYDEKTSFAKKIRYAVERASKLGTGSSRVVFKIMYEGRPTALKIAKNKKGLAQNNAEGDWGMHRMYPDILTPLIDVDEENEMPVWIHMEMATKLKKSQFKQMTGIKFESFGSMLQHTYQRIEGTKHMSIDWLYNVSEEEQAFMEENELFQQVSDIMINFGMPAGDLVRVSNWGVYQNRPVLIDLGLNTQVHKDHYT